MNKQQFLAELASRYHTVGIEVLQTTVGSVKFYTVECLKPTASDSLSRLNIGFWVEDEGGAGETAYWSDRDPDVPVGQDQFILDINAYIAAKIGDGTIAAAFVDSVDLTNEKATAYAYALISGQWTEIKVLLRRKIDATIEHVILQTVIS